MKKLLVILILFSSCLITAQDKPDYSAKITGYVKAWFQADYSTNSSQYLVKQARMNIAGAVNEYASYKFQVDFTRLGKLTTTTTTINGAKVVSSASAAFSDILLDAAAIITPFKNFEITGGQFKVPYSTESLRSDQVLAFANRPLLTNVSPINRDLGVMLTYKIKGDITAELNAGSFNGTGLNKTENDRTLDYVLRGAVSPLKDFNFSLNYYSGKSAGYDLSYTGFGIDYKLGSLFLDGEYSLKSIGTATADLKGSSLFAFLYYDLAVDGGIVNTITPAFRYETFDPNTSTDKNEIGRMTFGLTFQFAKITFAHFRINYEKFDYKDGTTNPDKLIFEIQTRF